MKGTKVVKEKKDSQGYFDFCTTPLQGHFLAANEQCLKSLKYTRDEEMASSSKNNLRY